MLASDLAKIYGCANGTKTINQAVKRNIDKFPKEFYFQITEEENRILWSQIGTKREKNIETRGGKYNRPYVFAEQGISLLCMVLKTLYVKEISKIILDAFKEVNECQIVTKSLDLREENIRNVIYEIRGKQVILDDDIARLFNYSTKDLNRNVKNNIDRFPEYYCFQLTREEYENLRGKIFTSSYGGRRYLPYAFTEYGITILAGLLKSKEAINASIRIINAFIEMKKILSSNNGVLERLSNVEYKLLDHDRKLMELYLEFDKNNPQKFVYLNGQVYDAYSKILDLLNKAEKELIIIDGYADKSVLDIIKELKIKVTLIVKNKSLLKKLDIEKYNEQYHNLKIIYSDIFHDRFIVIDKVKAYHLGSSINHAGSKGFAINKVRR